MKKNDCLSALGLFLLAFFIWFRDTAWMTSSDDTLPILVALPLFFWLAAPWHWLVEEKEGSEFYLAFGVCVCVLGIAVNITFFLASGWVILLFNWLTVRLEKETLARCWRLSLLPLISFPWISLDLTQLGWWFRLSGAWVTGYVFDGLGFSVTREGTMLFIDGLPISIEAACAGLNTLQSMLISGSIVAYLLLGNAPYYWIFLPFLFVMSWISNTLRILVICFIALYISPELVMGSFHIWSGWGVLMLMFGLCWMVFSWFEPPTQSTLE